MAFVSAERVPLSLFGTIKESYYVLKFRGQWFYSPEKGFFVNYAANRVLSSEKGKALFVFFERKEDPSVFVSFINVNDDDFVKKVSIDLNHDFVETINNIIRIACAKHGIGKVYTASNDDEDVFYEVIDIPSIEKKKLEYKKLRKHFVLPKQKKAVKRRGLMGLLVFALLFGGEYFYFLKQKEQVQSAIDMRLGELQGEYNRLKSQTNRINRQIKKLMSYQILERYR